MCKKTNKRSGDADKEAWKAHDASELISTYSGPKWVSFFVWRFFLFFVFRLQLSVAPQPLQFPHPTHQPRHETETKPTNRFPLLIDTGSSDPFLTRELKPEALEAAASAAGFPLTSRMQVGGRGWCLTGFDCTL